jgi:hypothetical protein
MRAGRNVGVAAEVAAEPIDEERAEGFDALWG